MTASRETTIAEQLTTRRELELLRDLQRLANERAREEERIRTMLAEGLKKAEQVRDLAAAETERQFNEGRTAATTEYEIVTGDAGQLLASWGGFDRITVTFAMPKSGLECPAATHDDHTRSMLAWCA